MSRQCIKLGNDEEACLETETGELWFHGKNFPVYHYPVQDVWELTKLLLANRQPIIRNYQESKQHIGDNDIRVVAALDGMPADRP